MSFLEINPMKVVEIQTQRNKNYSSRDHFVHPLSQWETKLHCNVISHWLGTYTNWSILILTIDHHGCWWQHPTRFTATNRRGSRFFWTDFRWRLGDIKQHTIIWNNVDPDLCHHRASLGHNELDSSSKLLEVRCNISWTNIFPKRGSCPVHNGHLHINIWDSNVVITVPADALEFNGPSHQQPQGWW